MLTDAALQQRLRQHHLFEHLPEALFQHVCQRALYRHIETAAVLFHQAAAAERFYLLLSGQIALTRVLQEGQEKLVEVITPGECFAEALMFNGSPNYPVTATAYKSSELISIDAQHFRSLLEGQPNVCLALLGSLSIRLHQRLNEIDTLTQASASRRVVRFLCQEAQAHNDHIQLKVSKRLIASQLGIQPETFSRILHRLVEAGLIQMERRLIRVPDRTALANFQD
ncbi:Crp/Fnr family transcriptional regulator [Ectopseudomonas mendocina]|uniref:Crp/Fnr family transcriptional regulator n=1 Tax=Ectopseudomonas mendocina TaxID=300 RepID=A0ABZ2RCV7_ECTME